MHELRKDCSEIFKNVIVPLSQYEGFIYKMITVFGVISSQSLWEEIHS